MSSPPGQNRAIIVCPLEFERAVLMHAGIGELAEVDCCGPGVRGVETWAAQIEAGGRLLILCGVAGATSARFKPGTAHVIDEVRNERGESWRPEPLLTSGPDDRCVLVTTEQVVTTPDLKANLAKRTGADLVDQESAALAAIAQQRGWNWQIVRGVSDGADDLLPAEIDQWVDEHGRTRHGSVIRALLRRPGLIGHLMRLRQNSHAAMAVAAGLVRSIIERETQSH